MGGVGDNFYVRFRNVLFGVNGLSCIMILTNGCVHMRGYCA